MAQDQPLVTAAVVNFNGMKHLEDCLRSLVSQTYPNLEVLVSDDCSTDGSVEFIKSNYPSVRIVQNPRNSGFVATANRAMKSASADWVILLNNDIECEPDFVERLMKAALRSPDYGIFAPKMRLFYARSVLNSVGNCMCRTGYGADRGIGEADEGQYDEPCEVLGACGGAMLAKRAVLEAVDYMDPAFYFLFDDIDLCWRAWLLGFKILTVPDAVVYHKYGGFYGKVSTLKYFLSARNRLRSFLKHYEWKTVRSVLRELVKEDMAQIAGMRKFRVEGRRGVMWAIAKSYLWNVLHLPGTLLKRWRIQRARVVSDEEMKRLIFQGPGHNPVIVPSYDIVDLPLFKSKDVLIDAIRMGESDQDSLGPGWDAAIREPGETAYHRTTAKKAFFYLRVLDPKKRWLNLDVKGVPKPMVGTVRMNGELCGDFSLEPEERRTLSFPCPQNQLNQHDSIECVLELNETWRPIDYYDTLDNRPIGIHVYEATLGAAPSVDSGLSFASVLSAEQRAALKRVLVLRSARPHVCVRALRQLREELPEAKVSLLLQENAESTPYGSLIDETIPLHGAFDLESQPEVVRDLKNRQFDLCVVVYGAMERESYCNVEAFAEAVGAGIIVGVPHTGEPVVLNRP